MQVACFCGQGFSIDATMLPHKVSCFACGRKFYVDQDGAISDARDIKPIKVIAHCVCGQAFAIWTEHFPHPVRCNVCMHQFNVLDTGESVEFGESTPVNPSTAIRQEPGSPLGGHSSPIVAKTTKEHFGVEPDALSQQAKMRAEVELIDCKWRIERASYSLLPFFGLEVIPSKGAAGYVAIVIGLGLMFVYAMFLEGNNAMAGDICLLLSLLWFIPLFLYQRADAYECAECKWQRARIAAIAKYEAFVGKG